MAGAFSSGKELWDPSHRFETSWLLPPYVLFFFRAIFSLYIFVVLVFILGWYCGHSDLGGCTQADDEFSYFTVLTYWGLGFYFLVSAIHTITYARTGTPLLDRFPPFLQAMHSAFYTTATVFPFVVTIVYWTRLYSGTWFPTMFLAWSNISQHAMNSFFALFEIVVPRTAPPPPIHMVWLIIILALYLGLAYLTEYTKGFYVYSFLDPSVTSKGLIVAYIFGILIGSLIIFGVVYGLISLRKYLTETKGHMEGKFARQAGWRREQDMEMSANGNGK